MGTWLPDQAEGLGPDATGFDRVFGLRPDLSAPFREFYAVFWRDRLVDPVVLELCRLRVAQLLGCASEMEVRYEGALRGGMTEEMVAELAQWPTSEHFIDAQRAALAFAEQFVIDPRGIKGAVRDALREHFTLPEVVAITEALALFDGFMRFRLMLGVEGPTEPAEAAEAAARIVVDPSSVDTPLP
ncbi:MAG: carboxymuconolactone decarboxylase family protein [Acidimicrobiia bacterium]|nr:carboxymuconolactone decarboxylase family protein [Acidimicrobiia bacterium]